MNDLSWLYTLGGLHVCASLFLGVFTVNFMMNLKSSLHCPNCQGGCWGGGVGAVRYYLSAPRSVGSFESQSISFEAGRVLRIRKQQFRVSVWHTRNHLVLTFINELWELARRISIFITWGVKEVHRIRSWITLCVISDWLNQWFVYIAKGATNECVMNSFYFQFPAES